VPPPCGSFFLRWPSRQFTGTAVVLQHLTRETSRGGSRCVVRNPGGLLHDLSWILVAVRSASCFINTRMAFREPPRSRYPSRSRRGVWRPRNPRSDSRLSDPGRCSRKRAQQHQPPSQVRRIIAHGSGQLAASARNVIPCVCARVPPNSNVTHGRSGIVPLGRVLWPVALPRAPIPQTRHDNAQ